MLKDLYETWSLCFAQSHFYFFQFCFQKEKVYEATKNALSTPFRITHNKVVLQPSRMLEVAGFSLVVKEQNSVFFIVS